MKETRRAYDGLIALSRSVLFEMAKLDEKMRPILLGRGIEKLPDEPLEKVLLLAIDEDLRTKKLMRLVCKRFSNIIKHHPAFLESPYIKNGANDHCQSTGRLGNIDLTVYLGDDRDCCHKILDAMEALVPLAYR